MKELALSKQINERKDFFPWLKVFLSKLVKKFPNDLDKEILQFLIQNIEEEINSYSYNDDIKRKEALFDTIYDLFLHFWWRIRWNGKKKWRRYWKLVSSEVSYVYDERTKCCEQLLYYIIFLGIILCNGCPDSEWIGKVFEAINILPSFDDMVYNSLLQVNNLEKKYHHVYITILKHILCSEVAENISEPITYVKIIMLFRRLKKFTKDKIALSALKSVASSIKPPSDTIQWLSSLEINVSLEKHKNVAKALLSSKCPNSVFRKLNQVISGNIDSEQKAESLSYVNEEIDEQKDISHIKHCKHKRKTHRSHPKAKLKESNASHYTDAATAATSTSLYNSKIKIRLNHKMLAGFKTSPRLKELDQAEVLKKKNHLKNSNISNLKANDVNEFLNFSFAEISNFSKNVTPQNKKLQCAIEGRNVNENSVLPEETYSNVSFSNINISSSFNHKRKEAEFCNGIINDKRIKLDAKKDCNKMQSAQDKPSCNYETSKSDEIACFNSVGTMNSNDILPENNSRYQEISEGFVPSLSHSPNHLEISNCNLFNKETAVTKNTCNPTKAQQNLQTSALLKLFQPLDVNLIPSLPSNVSMNTSIQKGTGQYDIDWNHLNTATDELCAIMQKTDNSKLNYEVSPNISIVNDTGKYDVDHNHLNAQISVNESSSVLQKNANSKQNLEMFPIANLQNNNLSQIDCKNTNSAIATKKSSSLPCSNINLNESMDKSSMRFVNFEDPSSRLGNGLTPSASWVENSLNTKDHRWGKGQSMIPTISRTLEFNQNNSIDNIQHSTLNSKVFHENNSINQRTDDRVCITQHENTSHCVVDCKIVSDYDPNNSRNNESTSSIKVIVNITCKTPEKDSNRQKEHIFGNFDDERTKQGAPNTSDNYFNSLNPFNIATSSSEMPLLTPYYDDPPFLTKSIDAIATPPDSELEINVPGSFKRDNIKASKKLITNNLLEKRTCLTTPKSARRDLSKKLLADDSDFRTPDTSDCETSNEWSLENTNLTNSLLLINSLQNSPVDNVLEQLNSRTSFTPNKKDTCNADTTLNSSTKKVPYRSNEDIYSGDDFSDVSTISCLSNVSNTDDGLNSAFEKHTNHKRSKDDSKQKLKVFRKKRKNQFSKKWQPKDLQGDSSCTVNHRYNLRSREKLLKPSKFEGFLTTHE